jgi:putative endonuclease
MSAGGPLRRILPGAIGTNYEKSAEVYLHRHGLKTLQRNYRCRRGEIDLVMTHDEYVVFVEVRYRASREFGDPLETITPRKQRRIIAAATHFLASNAGLKDRACRFDAVGVTGHGDCVEYDWITDAFST